MSDSTATNAAASSTSIPQQAVITNFPSVPLTTTFTQPADCNGLYLSNGLFVIDASTSCLPSFFNPFATAYYSPGLDCPSGYTTACQNHKGVASVTTVTCCPTRSGIGMSCQPTPGALDGIFSTMFCTWTPPSGDTTTIDITVSSDGTTSISAATFAGEGGFNALGVRMVYEASDLITSTSSTTGPSSNTATTTSSSSTSTSATSSPTSAPASGLSTGAKAAIGIVIPLVVLGVLAGLFLWWRKKNQQKKYNSVAPASYSPAEDNKAPPMYGGHPEHGNNHQMYQGPIYEMATPQVELEGNSPQAELADVSPRPR